MRAVFDQYSNQENQLTHALLSALACDRSLARDFLDWIGAPARPVSPQFLQQSLPGDLMALSEGEADRRGLPDGVIHEPGRYTILIESKVAASPTVRQLNAHLETARRKGYVSPSVLLLTIRRLPQAREPSWLTVREWSEVYAWLKGRPKAFWSAQLLGFLEAKEARWAEEGYLREGTLTRFAGIPFDKTDEPYNYFQAKRLIKLMRRELLEHPAVRSLNADVGSAGRPAITGRNSELVWDMIPIRSVPGGESFNQNAHLTFAILRDCLQAYVTIPNNIRSRRRTKLLGAGEDHFRATVAKVVRGFDRVLRKEPNARPAVIVLQRHYSSQRSDPEHDAELRFDPRTSFPGADPRIKHQPQWLSAAYESLKNRRSNLQLQIGMDFPYASCPKVRSAKAIDLVAAVWEACRPVLDAMEES